MKYLWAIILIILDLLWICFTIYDFVYCIKSTNEYIKDTAEYRNRDASLYSWLSEFFSEVEGASMGCIICNIFAIFIYSLAMYIHSLG